jgi:hypothetical protein
MSAIITGNWLAKSGSPTTNPGAGAFNVDSFGNPTSLALSYTDNDGTVRDLSQMAAGNAMYQRSPTDDQNFQKWNVVSVTNNTTWIQASVSVIAQGLSFTAPGNNQLCQLELDTGAKAGVMQAQYLLDDASAPGTGNAIDLGGMYMNKSFYTIVRPGNASFNVDIQASMDGDNWFSIGVAEGSGLDSENQHTCQFLRAKLVSVSPGTAVTVLVSWV